MSLKLPPVPLLAPADLWERARAGETFLLLDVREEEERGICQIPALGPGGDLHIPLGQVPLRVAEISEKFQGGTLAVYCHHGIRSLIAARWLATQGLDPVVNIDGGIDAWSATVDASVPRYEL